MITRDTRLAWALARDDGMRSQHGVIVDKLEVGTDIQVGVRGGVGAGVNADYSQVASCIAGMAAPLQSVGDALNCRGVLSDKAYKQAASVAALSAAQVVGRKLSGFNQWSPERQRLLYWVALAALERVWVKLYAIPEKLDYKGREEGRTLDEPWKVGKWLRGKHGQTLPLKNWGKQWAGVWVLLQDAIYDMDAAGIDLLDECIHKQKARNKGRRAVLQG
ncbi:MAG: hypothetical protein CME80_08410 [Halomonas sp.]|nr:hypothetical protein [Halomonas sp.]MBF57726.1 hypothetical protein [Halomonas sp.]|tara:strand:+ start:22036 stop:22692 length:657 start_codon:yes stop_codon:yes gene_type:complete